MLVFNLLVAVALVTAALFNLSEAYGQYGEYRDARGLRGFVASITMLAGIIALVAGTSTFRVEWPDLAGPLRFLSFGAVMVFLVGVVFSAVSWRVGPRGDE